jgi:hypothetical protein
VGGFNYGGVTEEWFELSRFSSPQDGNKEVACSYQSLHDGIGKRGPAECPMCSRGSHQGREVAIEEEYPVRGPPAQITVRWEVKT